MPRRVEVPKMLVFLGDHNRLDRPQNRESRIIPPHATFAFWSVKFINQVIGFGVVGQGDKPMCETLGNIHHSTVFGR